MGIPILIYGKSGTGKSTSLRNFTDNVGVINVTGKPLPFRTELKQIVTDDYDKITKFLNKATVDTIVIDDAGYLITNFFMRNHSQRGSGNAIFTLYNELADNFWQLIETIKKLPPKKVVYLLMHEEKSETGDIGLKTIGKLLNDKVCIEGLVTICLRSAYECERYVFHTQTSGYCICKSPMDMFSDRVIDNDLKYVDDTIREYYSAMMSDDDIDFTKKEGAKNV